MDNQPKKYYYNNPETGETEEISKETHDAMQFFRRPPRLEKGIGRVFVAGTGETERDHFKELYMAEVDPISDDPRVNALRFTDWTEKDIPFNLANLDAICRKAKRDLHKFIDDKFYTINAPAFGSINITSRRIGRSFRMQEYFKNNLDQFCGIPAVDKSQK